MPDSKPLVVKRYPASTNRSLRAWSAADEYLLETLNNLSATPKKCIVYNDSFGYLSTHIDVENVDVVIETASQQGAIEKNLEANKRTKSNRNFLSPFDKPRLKPEVGLLKMPKSLDLFELYLQHFAKHCSVKGVLFCGFMTRHFTKQMLDIASVYFDSVEQSLAKKKARLLILKGVKKINATSLMKHVKYGDLTLSQYYGVFSANMVDPGTQFLLENYTMPTDVHRVMDLACGNGVLAKVLLDKKPELEMHLVEDSMLALESAKLNITSPNTHFHLTYSLNNLDVEEIDYIICNPPFHVDHEIDISLPLRLFKEAHDKLHIGGYLELVANQHLNYKTHLSKMFTAVDVVAENSKYVVYRCTK